uniref:hypothetical protein n=1 Tax=Cylindrospermopsis curvispora TaxID=747548 RepID=UPI001CA6ADB7|nr:hypothetical protein [Cylindrospermopsis curvispora]
MIELIQVCLYGAGSHKNKKLIEGIAVNIACGVDKPLKNHLETTMKQEVGSPDL